MFSLLLIVAFSVLFSIIINRNYAILKRKNDNILPYNKYIYIDENVDASNVPSIVFSNLFQDDVIAMKKKELQLQSKNPL
jgi:transcriptional regulator of NAD metabolism